MFKVFINDGTQDPPSDNIYYMVAKGGIYLKKKVGAVESLTKVDKISVLEPVTEEACLNVAQIPAIDVARILTFFREVYDKFNGGESIVLLYYNFDTDEYRVRIPKQEVAGAGLKYEPMQSSQNFQLMGTIHSHGSMSAFHSGVDDKDELDFDGLHITFGHVNSDHFSISASIVINGTRFMCNPSDYLENVVEEEYEVSYKNPVARSPNKSLWGYLEYFSKGRHCGPVKEEATYTVTKKKGYVVKTDPSHFIIPDGWMENVSKRNYVYQSSMNSQLFDFGTYYPDYSDPHRKGDKEEDDEWLNYLGYFKKYHREEPKTVVDKFNIQSPLIACSRCPYFQDLLDEYPEIMMLVEGEDEEDQDEEMLKEGSEEQQEKILNYVTDCTWRNK